MLLHLAQAANYASKNVENHPGPIRAAACAMIFFNRITNAAIAPDYVEKLEVKAGKAVLEALISVNDKKI
jgi:uridine phosphorylase